MRFAFAPLRRASFGAIAIDPPWRFSSNSEDRPGRNAMRHYKCMRLPDLCALPVGELAAPDCWLFLWVTAPFLAQGDQRTLCEAWGFSSATIGFVWVKSNRAGPGLFQGLGHSTRQNAEFVVVGRRGRPVRASRSVHSVIVAPRREHSRKPDEFYARVERLVGDVPKAELFARERRGGWSSWGDEIGKFDDDSPVKASTKPSRDAGPGGAVFAGH